MEYDLAAAIPHRPPFLLLDDILELTKDNIRAAYTPRPDSPLWREVYAGHYPGQAITPGVLVCEMALQAAAVLAYETAKTEKLAGVPVVTRLQNVKFKKMLPPGVRVEIRASLQERLANAFFMKGEVKSDAGVIAQLEFAVAFAPAEPAPPAEPSGPAE